MDDPNEDEDLIPPNERRPQRLLDSRRQDDGELSDSDDEGEGGRRDHKSHRDPDVASTSGRRFGAAVGIMSTGSTHGIGPTMALPVSTGTAPAAAGPSGSSAVSEMDVDEDDAPLAQTVRSKPKGKSPEDGMAVDPPAVPAATEQPPAVETDGPSTAVAVDKPSS